MNTMIENIKNNLLILNMKNTYENIDSYLEPTKNFENKISNATLIVSDTIQNYMVKGIEFVFSGIGKLIE